MTPVVWSTDPSCQCIELPSPFVSFHKVIENDEVVDTLAVMADGRSISCKALFQPERFDA